jgi:hypothetical protein
MPLRPALAAATSHSGSKRERYGTLVTTTTAAAAAVCNYSQGARAF